MAGITTNPEFRTRAARLHAACAERGLHLRHGAAETFLAQPGRRAGGPTRRRHGPTYYGREPSAPCRMHVDYAAV